MAAVLRRRLGADRSIAWNAVSPAGSGLVVEFTRRGGWMGVRASLSAALVRVSDTHHHLVSSYPAPMIDARASLSVTMTIPPAITVHLHATAGGARRRRLIDSDAR